MNDDFEKELNAFPGEVRRALTVGVKAIARDLQNRIVEKTPVSTGEARANWQMTLGGPATTIVDVGEGVSAAKARQLAKSTQKVLSGLKQFENVLISNPVEHVVRLEEGDARTAPRKMVRLSLAEVEAQGSKYFDRGDE